MARTPASRRFEIGETTLLAGWSEACAAIPFTREDERLIIHMDDVETWQDGAEISLTDLQRLFDLVERECLARGVEVEFE